MPTSAGPNISGEENLVFGYDLSDQKNSYLGEPTTNLAVAPLDITSGYSSAAGITRTTGTELNFTGQNNAGLISRSGGGGWTAYTGGVSGAGNGVRFTTTWYLKAGTATTVSVNWGGAHTGNRTDFVVDLTTGAVSSVTIASGEFYKVERAPNDFYRIMYSSTLTASTYFPQISPVASTGTIIFGGIQIERNSHATPFTIGTRSGTQGLIDISGNSTIDMTNVSFDSDALMTFDGTNDYSSIGNPTSLRDLTRGSIESIFYRVASTGTYQMIFTDAGSDLEITYLGNVLQFYIGNSGLNHTHPLTGQWFHIICTWDVGYKKIYLNGDEVATGINLGIDTGSRDRYIGGRGTSFPFNGKIPMVKIMDRPLSSSEVLNNYNNIKRKYGI